jgi:TonB-linked SusC/RagA family outer membrane protein
MKITLRTGFKTFVLLLLWTTNLRGLHAEDYPSDQGTTMAGVVTSSDDKLALPGVNILIRGTTIGTTTDAEGKYVIPVEQGAVLVFSFIGYATQEITVGTQTSINVSLESDFHQLGEVVVVGYGAVEKKDLIGAVGVATRKDFGDVPVANAQQLIQGKISGVQVVNSSGLPGAGVKIAIRGTGTFTSIDPLYVIDGMQGDASLFNAINAYDIESITVLKDASSTAIYGANAANGVVIVTTKKAKAGLPRVTYNGYYGVAQPWKKMDMMNATQYLDLVRDITNNTLTPKLESDYVKTDRTDWQDAIFRTATISEHNIGISGGTEKVLYQASTTYTNQDGIMEDYNFKRLGIRLSLEEILGKRFKFGQTFNFQYALNSGNPASFTDALRMPTYSPIYDATNLGGFAKVTSSDDLNDAFNPLTGIRLSERRNRDFLTFGQFFGEVNIVPNLKFRSQVSIDLSSSTSYSYHRANANGNLLNPNGIDESYGWSINPLLENYLNFNKKFGVHAFDVIAGNTYRNGGKFRSVNLTGNNFPNDDLKTIIAAPSASLSGGNTGQYASLSYFGRINYTLMEKYLVTASFRRDGNYVFSAANRFGNFPSVGIAWKMSEEGFMQALKAVSELKIRASYGITGNSSVPLQFSSIWKGQSNNIVYSLGSAKGYAQGATINSSFDPNIQWETTKQFDVGLDLGLYEDRFTLSVGYYDRKNEDLLTYVPVPLSTGIGGPYDNPGNILKNIATASNKGVELDLGYRGNIGAFGYSLTANAAYNKNKVVSLGAGAPFQRGTVNGGNLATKTDEDQPIGSFYGYVVDHVAIDQSDVDAYNLSAQQVTGQPTAVYQTGLLPGDIIFRDIDGDGMLTSLDRTFLGSPIPVWNYGANVNLAYKNFDFMLGLYGISDVKLWNDLKYWTEGTSRPFNSSSDLVNRWRTEGDVSEYPMAGQNATGSANLRPSDRFVEDGSYMRLRNVTLGYKIPVGNAQGLGKVFSSLRLYVTANNLLTLTKYKGYDPEVVGQDFLFERGIDRGQYPQPKTYMLGIQARF